MFGKEWDKALTETIINDAPTIAIGIDVEKLSEISTKYSVKIDFEVKEDGGCEVWIEPMGEE